MRGPPVTAGLGDGRPCRAEPGPACVPSPENRLGRRTQDDGNRSYELCSDSADDNCQKWVTDIPVMWNTLIQRRIGQERGSWEIDPWTPPPAAILGPRNSHGTPRGMRVSAGMEFARWAFNKGIGLRPAFRRNRLFRQKIEQKRGSWGRPLIRTDVGLTGMGGVRVEQPQSPVQARSAHLEAAIGSTAGSIGRSAEVPAEQPATDTRLQPWPGWGEGLDNALDRSASWGGADALGTLRARA
jgi:hypothetical protein